LKVQPHHEASAANPHREAQVKAETDSAGMTRRQFVAAGAMAGAALAAGCSSLRENRGFLSAENACTLAALCDQIIPADDYPSASQAGAVTYIERQLMHHFRPHRRAYEMGLEQAELLSRKRFGISLAEASAQQQLWTAQALEKQNPRFFAMVCDHTREGYYGSPRHGGNRNAVSWRMLGLSEPPVRGRASYDVTRGSGS
jgi:gluconate 2-dehydrogenase gamma chain